MSLINDALRRKNDGKKDPAPEKPEGSPMQPVHPTARSNNSYLKPILLGLIVFVLGMAAMLFWKGWQTKNEIATTAKPASPVTFPERMENKPLAPPIVTSPPAPVVEPISAAATEVSPVTNPVVPPVVAVPPLKLQGIFFRPSNPTAMINGKTVSISDIVSGARVLKIERQEVVVERDGKMETLRME